MSQTQYSASVQNASTGFMGNRGKFGNGDHDVVIVSALRTPICKARKGAFKDTLPDDLLSAVFTGVIKDAGILPSMVQDICVGNVLQPGAGAQVARLAQFLSGIPETVTIGTVNRFCSSGLQACINIARSIQAGDIDIGIGAGMETMTINALNEPAPGFVLNPKVDEVQLAKDCLLPMGITSENVAKQYGITREMQDKMAVESHAKATNAQKNGYFKAEIVPVTTRFVEKDGTEKVITVDQDDGIRAGVTMQGLAKLKPAFQEGGSTTAGNASQVSDGAAAVLLTRRATAVHHHLSVLGVLRGYAVVGVPPDVMGIGPAHAIPEVLRRTGLTLDDIDIFELNEAFASQATYCCEKLGIPREKLNPNGGAIALGHPVGCTGSRQVATLLHELKRRGKRGLGVVSMCVGTGMGAAAVFEYPGPANLTAAM